MSKTSLPPTNTVLKESKASDSLKLENVPVKGTQTLRSISLNYSVQTCIPSTLHNNNGKMVNFLMFVIFKVRIHTAYITYSIYIQKANYKV